MNMDIVSSYKEKGVEYLYYICSIENLNSIFIHGLLSKNRMQEQGIQFKDISNEDVQMKRNAILIGGKYKLHDYVNLYFDARNPMMYTLHCHEKTKGLCVLCIDPIVLEIDSTIVTDGNAASELTYKSDSIHGLDEIDFVRVFQRNWTSKNNIVEYHENKRIKCSEVLVNNVIPSKLIKKIYVSNIDDKIIIDKTYLDIPIEVNKDLFFVGEKISYV